MELTSATRERTKYEKILHGEGMDPDCEQSIKHLSVCSSVPCNKPIYILLDEYDTPLHATYADKFYVTAWCRASRTTSI